MSLVKTKYLPLDVDFKRAGIIFYFYENKELYFIFALDANHGEMTDMGGSIELNENFIEAAIRETYEESLGIFNYMNDVEFIKNNSFSIHSDKTIILLQRINADKHKLISLFKNEHIKILYDGIQYIENSSLFWISADDLQKLIKTNKKIKNHNLIPTYKESNVPLPLSE